MSTISSVGSGGSGGNWAAAVQSRRFAKVDGDGSGSVDTSELQGLLDHVADKTGRSLGSADTLLTQMDSDGNGSLNADELNDGMQSLLPPPSSTVEFAQQRGGTDDMDADAGRTPPPSGPPAGGRPDGAGAASGGTSTSVSTDPLDTDGDGTVSAQERAAGEMKELLTQLMSAIDSNGDQSISEGEVGDFLSKLDGAASASASAGSSPASGEAAGSDAGAAGGNGAAAVDERVQRALQALTELVRGEYARHAGSDAADDKPKVDVAA